MKLFTITISAICLSMAQSKSKTPKRALRGRGDAEERILNQRTAPFYNTDCGGHSASSCANCPWSYDKQTWNGESGCNGDCKWAHNECVDISTVDCGSHSADSCANCPWSLDGKNWYGEQSCNGACKWEHERCVDNSITFEEFTTVNSISPEPEPEKQPSCNFCSADQTFVNTPDQKIQFSSGNDSVSCAGLLDLISSGLGPDFCESERTAIEAHCCVVTQADSTPQESEPKTEPSCEFCSAAGPFLDSPDQRIKFSSGNDSVSCAGLLDLISSGLGADFCESERTAIEFYCCPKGRTDVIPERPSENEGNGIDTNREVGKPGQEGLIGLELKNPDYCPEDKPEHLQESCEKNQRCYYYSEEEGVQSCDCNGDKVYYCRQSLKPEFASFQPQP